MIRHATLADVRALARLGAATFVETFGHLYRPPDLAAFLSGSRSEAAYRKTLQSPGVCALLAFVDDIDDPVGYAVAGPCKLPVGNLEAQAGELRELYVLGEFQRHKLGSALLTAALAWLQARKHAPLYIGVWSQNTGAQRLYGRFGFNKAGEYDFPVGGQIDREFILKR